MRTPGRFRSHTRRLRMPERQRMTTRLKALFQRPELFVLAGGINPIGAKMAEALGYDAFYMSGGNTSAHQLGWPDSGTSMRDMVGYRAPACNEEIERTDVIDRE